MLLLGRGGGTVVFLDSYCVQLEKFLVRYECHLNSAGLLAEVSPTSVFGGLGSWRKKIECLLEQIQSSELVTKWTGERRDHAGNLKCEKRGNATLIRTPPQ
jgi:hypothetical protein